MSDNPRLHLQTDLSEQQNAGFTPCELTAAADSHSSDDGTRACGVSSWQISNILLLWRLSLSVSTNIPALNRSRIIWEHQTPRRPLCFFVRGLVCSWASRSEPPGGDYHSLLSGAPSPSSGGIPGTMFSAHRRTEIQPKSPTPLDLSLTQFGGGILWVWISWKHQLHKENLQQQNTERRAAQTDRQADVQGENHFQLLREKFWYWIKTWEQTLLSVCCRSFTAGQITLNLQQTERSDLNMMRWLYDAVRWH